MKGQALPPGDRVTGRRADLSTVTGLLAASDGELDAVVVEAVHQAGFIEGGSWRVHPPPDGDITDTREREKVEESTKKLERPPRGCTPQQHSRSHDSVTFDL